MREYVRLTSICTPKQWKTISTKELKPEGYPVYGANGIIGYYEEYNHQNETVMITCRGATCGTVNISVPKAYITGNAMCLDSVDENKVQIKYLYYVLKAYDFTGVISGSAQPQITREGLQKVKIPLIELSEQKKIVELLDKIESSKEKRREQLIKLDDLVKSQFIEMFGDPVRNEKSWDVVKLSEIAEFFNGLTYRPDDVGAGTIVLRSSNIQDGELDFSDIVRVRTNIRERLFVRTGDLLMCSRNGSAKLVGKVAPIGALNEPMTFGAFMMIIRSSMPEYLMTYFRTEAFREQIKTGATTTINQITATMLNKVRLPLPPTQLVNRYARFVEQTDKSKIPFETEVAA